MRAAFRGIACNDLIVPEISMPGRERSLASREAIHTSLGMLGRSRTRHDVQGSVVDVSVAPSVRPSQSARWSGRPRSMVRLPDEIPGNRGRRRRSVCLVVYMYGMACIDPTSDPAAGLVCIAFKFTIGTMHARDASPRRGQQKDITSRSLPSTAVSRATTPSPFVQYSSNLRSRLPQP
jgi:hypothetical protein